MVVEDQNSSIKWEKGKTGCPLIMDSIAYLECTVKVDYKPGNHALFIGEVIHAQGLSDLEPMNTGDYESMYLGKS